MSDDPEPSSPERAGSPGPRHARALTAFGAFLMYLAASVLIWGIPVVGHLQSRYVAIGRVADPDYFRWALGWTPWALAHGHSPFHTGHVFAPEGIDLTWSTLIPGPAAVMWPITRTFGTLASYNVLMLAAPALAAWGAFLVCRRVTDRFWPSVVGGYLFGFSSYMAAGMSSHPNLVLIFPAPLAVYLVIRRVEGSLGAWAFVGLLALTLLGLFSISPELFATTTLFGGIAFVAAWLAADGGRGAIVRAAASTAAALAIVAALVLVPYVLPALGTTPSNLERSGASADLLGFVIPRDQTLVGGVWLRSVSDPFTARVTGDGSYLGIAGLAIVVGFAITERRRRSTWALVAFVVAGMVLSLGSVLRIRGVPSVPMPHALLAHLPLIEHAAPDRFPAYVSLAVGVIAAIWLARAHGKSVWARWSLVVVTAVMLLPSIRTPPWHFTDRTPTFFSSGASSTVLRPDEIVAVIAEGRGENMSWQASAGFTFRMPWGYVGIAALAPQGESTGEDLFAKEGRAIPAPRSFARALARHQVTAVVLADAALPAYEAVVRSVGLEDVYRGEGVSVWRFTPGS